VKVRGKWTYLYRALDKAGNTIDFYLPPKRTAKAAKRILGKAMMNGLKDWEKPAITNTDKAPTYGIAISELTVRRRGDCRDRQLHTGAMPDGPHISLAPIPTTRLVHATDEKLSAGSPNLTPLLLLRGNARRSFERCLDSIVFHRF